jgi:hypothetical protein
MRHIRAGGRTYTTPWAAIATVFVLILLLAGTSVAYAYCPVGPNQNHTSGAAGKMDWQFWEAGPTAASSLLNSYRPDPVIAASTSWVMLSRWQNSGPSYAQTGWLRHYLFSPTYHYIFSQTRQPSESIPRTAVLQLSPPTGYHLYETHHVANPGNHFRFFYDSSQWDSSQVVSWSPSRVEFGSESLNRGDHFPGSTVNRVEFFNTSYKRQEVWYASNLTYRTFGSYGIAGFGYVSARTFQTWDTRCSD